MSDFFKRAEQMFRESAEDFCQKQLKASSQSLDAFIARNTDPINKGGWAGFQQVFFGCPVRNHKKLAATFIKRARKQRVFSGKSGGAISLLKDAAYHRKEAKKATAVNTTVTDLSNTLSNALGARS